MPHDRYSARLLPADEACPRQRDTVSSQTSPMARCVPLEASPWLAIGDVRHARGGAKPARPLAKRSRKAFLGGLRPPPAQAPTPVDDTRSAGSGSAWLRFRAPMLEPGKPQAGASTLQGVGPLSPRATLASTPTIRIRSSGTPGPARGFSDHRTGSPHGSLQRIQTDPLRKAVAVSSQAELC